MVPNETLVRCPKCDRLMTSHNVRMETNDFGQSDRVETYICFTHGFYRFDKNQSLRPAWPPPS
jgi:hypothetical protein